MRALLLAVLGVHEDVSRTACGSCGRRHITSAPPAASSTTPSSSTQLPADMTGAGSRPELNDNDNGDEEVRGSADLAALHVATLPPLPAQLFPTEAQEREKERKAVGKAAGKDGKAR